MKRRPKGRVVPRPNERIPDGGARQWERMNPVIRQNIERLAQMGHKEHGRGMLFVTVNPALEHGIERVDYATPETVALLVAAVPNIDHSELLELVRTYDPACEFVAMIVNATRSLPNPVVWFDRYPWSNPPQVEPNE